MPNDITTSQRDASIATLWLQGVDQRDIANKFNVHQSTVSRILNKETIREKTSAAIQAGMHFIPEVILRVMELIRQDGDLGVATKNIQTFGKWMGMEATHTLPHVVQNIFIDQVNVALDVHLTDQPAALPGPGDVEGDGEIIDV